MFKKNDPLVDAVKSVMKESDLDRQAEAAVNEAFGVVSRKAIPHEKLAEYDAALMEAKKMCQEEDKLHGNQHVIASQAHPKDKINKKDFDAMKAKKAKGIPVKSEMEESWHEESGKKKELDEREMTSADKEKEAELKKKYDPSGMKAAMKEKYGKKKGKNIYFATIRKQAMKEDVNTVMEEIRSNLEEQLVSVYESGDEQAFADFVSSLTEEQLDILGLTEAGERMSLGGESKAKEFFSSFLPSSWQNDGGRPGYAKAPDTSSMKVPEAGPSSAGNSISKTFAGADAAKAGATSTPDAKAGSGKAGEASKTSAEDRLTSVSHMSGAPSSPSTPQATPNVLKSTSFTDRRPDLEARGTVAQTQATIAKDRQAELKKMKGPGGYSGTGIPAGEKIAPQVAAQRSKDNVPTSGTPNAPSATSSTPSFNKSNRMMSKSSMPQKRATPKMYGYGSVVGGDIASNVQAGLREEVKPQIKESFEQFLRNKFLKG